MTKEEAIEIFKRFVESKNTSVRVLVHAGSDYGYVLPLTHNGKEIASVSIYFPPATPKIILGEQGIGLSKEESGYLKELVEKRGIPEITFTEALNYL